MEMTTPQFKATVQAELERRFDLYKYWASIAPSDGAHKHRSWFLDKRNRPTVGIQKTRLFELDSAVDYQEWAAVNLSENDDHTGEPLAANADSLAEPVVEITSIFSDTQKDVARAMRANLANILTPLQYEIFTLHVEKGQSWTQIGIALARSPQNVFNQYKRAVTRLQNEFAKCHQSTDE